MANKNWPHGFHPVNNFNGRIPVTRVNLAAANTIIGVGDPVTATNAGVVDRGTAADTLIYGVAAEPKAANAGGFISIWADPNILFEAQADEADIAAITNLNLNYDFVIGDAVRGRSIAEIDSDTGDVTATLPFKVVGLYRDPRNAYGANVRVLCYINAHFLGKDKLGV